VYIREIKATKKYFFKNFILDAASLESLESQSPESSFAAAKKAFQPGLPDGLFSKQKSKFG
jgi:hypothetical protein